MARTANAGKSTDPPAFETRKKGKTDSVRTSPSTKPEENVKPQVPETSKKTKTRKRRNKKSKSKSDTGTKSHPLLCS